MNSSISYSRRKARTLCTQYSGSPNTAISRSTSSYVTLWILARTCRKASKLLMSASPSGRSRSPASRKKCSRLVSHSRRACARLAVTCTGKARAASPRVPAGRAPRYTARPSFSLSGGLMSGVAKMGSLRRAASGNVSGLFAAIRTGGWGVCTGFGTTVRSRPKVFSVGREVLLRPRLDDEVERLLEAFPALFLGYLVSRVVDRGRPAPHPELQTAVAEDVGDGRFFGDLHRAVQGQKGHRRPQ